MQCPLVANTNASWSIEKRRLRKLYLAAVRGEIVCPNGQIIALGFKWQLRPTHIGWNITYLLK